MAIPISRFRDPTVDMTIRLNQLRIGACITIGGIIVHREAEHRFHVEHAGEAMLGCAGTVVDWLEQLPRACASSHSNAQGRIHLRSERV